MKKEVLLQAYAPDCYIQVTGANSNVQNENINQPWEEKRLHSRCNQNPFTWSTNAEEQAHLSTLCGTSELLFCQPTRSRSVSSTLHERLRRTQLGGWRWSWSCWTQEGWAPGAGLSGCSPRVHCSGTCNTCLGHISSPEGATTPTSWWENNLRN